MDGINPAVQGSLHFTLRHVFPAPLARHGTPAAPAVPRPDARRPRMNALLLPAVYGSLLSLLTYAVYAHDKAAARRRRRRVPERVLHLLALLGGWPGAWLAQRLLRHKSRKLRFQLVFWLTVLLNLAVIVLLARAAPGA